jgi:hypothetical protein
MKLSFLKIIKSIKLQITAIAIAIFYTILFFTMQYKKIIFPEPIPKLLQVDAKIKKLATPVTVGIYINNFQSFSFSNNTFSMDAMIWFKFAKGSESIDTINKFTIKNSKILGDSSFIYKSAPIIKILDTDVLVCYHVYAEFMSNLNHKRFPIEHHRLTFYLQNRSVTAHELVFVTEAQNIVCSENILVENWTPKNTYISSGYVNTLLAANNKNLEITHPCVAFTIDFEGKGARLPISLYFPLFILFFIILLSLILNTSDPNRLGLVAAGVPALVLFRLVIDSSSPTVGYVTNIEAVFNLVSVISLFILFFQIYVLLATKENIQKTLDQKKRTEETIETISIIIFFLILFLLIIFLTFFLQ